MASGRQYNICTVRHLWFDLWDVQRIRLCLSMPNLILPMPEFYGVLAATEYMKQPHLSKRWQCVLRAVSATHVFKSSFVGNVRQIILTSLWAGCAITFSWVPSHLGIKGNENAHQFAASHRDLDITIVALVKPLSVFWHRSLQKIREEQSTCAP